MLRFLSATLIATFCIAILTVSIPAAAHGPGASALQVVDEDADGPSVVALTSGIAVKTDSGAWRFLCQTQFGSVETPLLGASMNGPVWIVGAEEAYLLEDGQLQATGVAELNATLTTNVAPAPDHVFALTGDGITADLWRLDDGGTATTILTDTETRWASMVTVGNDAWLAATQADGVALAQVDSDGNVLQEGTVTIDLQDGVGILRSSGSQLYILTVGGTDFALYAVDTESFATQLLITDSKPILGPVEVSGRLLVGARSELIDLTDGEMVVATDENMLCLRHRFDQAYACLQPDLVSVDETGFGDTLFETERLLGPVLDDLSEEDADACWEDWLHFAFEGSIPPDAEMEEGPDAVETADVTDAEDINMAEFREPPLMDLEPEDNGGDGCGCRATTTATPAPWLLVVLLSALVIRRRRRST